MPLTTLQSPLYLASSNPGKLREFSAAALVRGIHIEPLPGFASLPPCIEDGKTFEENARKKALHYSAFAAGPVFADDSGISVDAIGEAPGIYSARYAGPNATDDQNNRKLLDELRRVDEELRQVENLIDGINEAGDQPIRRTAHYVCIIALALNGKVLCVTEGRAHGIIGDEPHGTGGFGYDPYFYYPPLGKTFAELEAEEKFAVSHRGEAFRRLLTFLTQG